MSALILKKSKSIEIHSKLFFYGELATEALAQITAQEIEQMWNAPKANIRLKDGVYPLQFVIWGEVISRADAQLLNAEKPTVVHNFIEIVGEVRSVMVLGGNIGRWSVTDNLGKSTTAPHEWGHGVGLDHPPADTEVIFINARDEKVSLGKATDLRGQSAISIMAPRGTLVSPALQWSDKMSVMDIAEKVVEIREGATLNPAKRLVIAQDIADLHIESLLIDKDSAELGRVCREVY
jgi:hypothetical protein